MPELPEVENVRKSLIKDLKLGSKLSDICFLRKDLRFPIPQKSLKKLINSKLANIFRRGKYLLFEFTNGVMISHLGMTGQWRISRDIKSLKKHDHLYLVFDSDIFLIYNDPRRFGYVDYIDEIKLVNEHPLFLHLGLEPFAEHMNFKYLKSKASKAKRPIKVFLMDQEVVVGVGNIYASEVLFQAHVKPSRLASHIKDPEWILIVKAIKQILQNAIDGGGSTIRDYRKTDGSKGSYQDSHLVYGKDGQPCTKCKSPIKKIILGGRATFWCPKCQY